MVDAAPADARVHLGAGKGQACGDALNRLRRVVQLQYVYVLGPGAYLLHEILLDTSDRVLDACYLVVLPRLSGIEPHPDHGAAAAYVSHGRNLQRDRRPRRRPPPSSLPSR